MRSPKPRKTFLMTCFHGVTAPPVKTRVSHSSPSIVVWKGLLPGSSGSSRARQKRLSPPVCVEQGGGALRLQKHGKPQDGDPSQTMLSSAAGHLGLCG